MAGRMGSVSSRWSGPQAHTNRAAWPYPFNLDVPAAVRVGLVAQCPAGPGTTIDFLSFSVEERTAQNIRSGKEE